MRMQKSEMRMRQSDKKRLGSSMNSAFVIRRSLAKFDLDLVKSS